MIWPQIIPLSTLAKIGSGKRPNSVSKDITEKNRIPVIGGGGTSGYTDQALEESGVLITGRVGTLGKLHVAEGPCWPSDNALILKPISNEVDAGFLRYAVSNIISDAAGLNRGAANPLVTQKDIGNLKVSLFPLEEQRNIASTLSSLDDKIELNRQMNQTLEALARAVFEDWFVDFGPPRRKAAGITDPAAILGGLIPNPTQSAPLAALFPDSFGSNGLPLGWEVRVVSDDFDVEMGQSPPGSTYNETGDGLPFFQGRRDFQFRFPEKRVYCSAPTRTAEADWTLISVRAPVGDINRAWEKCCIGRGVGAMMHKKGLASFTYYVALHLQEELSSYDKDGTVFGSINQKQIKGLSVNATNSKAAKAFDDVIVPIDEMIRNNIEENQTLAATRDLLLPKLMSGELRLVGGEVIE